MTGLNTNKKVLISFIALTVVWLFSFFDTLNAMVEVWLGSNTYTHGFFILPICLFLIYEKSAELKQTEIKPFYPALVGIILIQFVYLLSTLASIQLFAQICAYISLLMIVLLVFGKQIVYAILFPLFYLSFSIPVGAELVPFLQDITAQFSVAMLQLTGIPVYQDGLYLYIPNGVFEVAEACAGIRFLIAAIALGTLYAYLNYNSYWRRTVFILVSCIVPIIANGIRAYGIIIIGHLSDMEYATGADHLIYGWFFFALVIFLLFLIGNAWREPLIEKTLDQTNTMLSNSSLKVTALIGGGLLLCASNIYLLYISKQTVVSNPLAVSEQLTLASPLATDTPDDVLSWQPYFEGADESFSGTCCEQANDVELFVARYNADTQGQELISGQNRYFNIEKWSVISSQQIELQSSSSFEATELKLTSVSGEKAQLTYWYKVDNQIMTSALDVKLKQLADKVKGKSGGGYFIAIFHKTALNNNPAHSQLLSQLTKLSI